MFGQGRTGVLPTTARNIAEILSENALTPSTARGIFLLQSLFPAVQESGLNASVYAKVSRQKKSLRGPEFFGGVNPNNSQIIHFGEHKK